VLSGAVDGLKPGMNLLGMAFNAQFLAQVLSLTVSYESK
jgi:hypothetical protein